LNKLTVTGKTKFQNPGGLGSPATPFRRSSTGSKNVTSTLLLTSYYYNTKLMKDLQHGSKREAASSQNFICLMTVQPSAQTGENEPDALLLFTIQ